MFQIVRCFRSACAWGASLAILFLTSTPAQATSVNVSFNGDGGFGVSEADALSISAVFDVPIVDPEFVGDAEGVLEVISQDLDVSSIDPFPPSGSGTHTATSSWTAQNVSEFDLFGATYLLFVTPEPFLFEGELIIYADANVGLTIDPADGWVFVRATDAESQQSFYFPSLLLGSLGADEITSAFDVNYVIDEEIQQVAGTFVLPQFQIGMAFIPEPSTGALLGLGMLLLASGRRRLL